MVKSAVGTQTNEDNGRCLTSIISTALDSPISLGRRCVP